LFVGFESCLGHDATITAVATTPSHRRRSKAASTSKPTLVYFTQEERAIVDQASRIERRSLISFIANATLDAADV
jgi:hypothetical protein